MRSGPLSSETYHCLIEARISKQHVVDGKSAKTYKNKFRKRVSKSVDFVIDPVYTTFVNTRQFMITKKMAGCLFTIILCEPTYKKSIISL